MVKHPKSVCAPIPGMEFVDLVVLAAGVEEEAHDDSRELGLDAS